MTDRAFWIDRRYDRENASDGESRYGHYLRDGDWAGAAEAGGADFAVYAWYRATSPVMAPGYVRCHRRVLAQRITHGCWDGSLQASVDLIAPWPVQIAPAAPGLSGAYPQRDDGITPSVYWQDWPQDGAHGFYEEPCDQDVTKYPWLLASTRLLFRIRDVVGDDDLRRARAGGRPMVESAQGVVEGLVTQMDAAVRPVIEDLGRD